MSAGHRIYYVPPRLAGRVSDWSGRDAKDGNSWLIDQAKAGKFNAIWFSPMHETTRISTEHHGKTRAGSIYAMRNHFALDPDFSSHPEITDRAKADKAALAKADADDREHLEHFNKKAKENGVTVFADLVLNHIARDHPLAVAETEHLRKLVQDCRDNGRAIKRIYDVNGHRETIAEGNPPHGGRLIGLAHENGAGGVEETFFKFKRDFDLTLSLQGAPGGPPWSDVAHINYASPEGMDFFVNGKDGEDGYWKQLVDWYADRGFTAFRCDVAYMVPSNVWEDVIGHAHDRLGDDVVFMAETLGGPDDEIRALGKAKITVDGNERPAFDLGMHSHYWWNYTDDWLPEQEVPRLREMAHYGGAGSPDNHDTEKTVAGAARARFHDKDEAEQNRIIAALSVRDYAITALTTNATYMQMGYEYCNEEQNSVFRDETTPADWQKLKKERGADDINPLNIQRKIARVNELKEGLGIENCRTEFRTVDNLGDDGQLVAIGCRYIDADSGDQTAEVMLLINKKPENGPAHIGKHRVEELKDNGRLHSTGGSENNDKYDISDIMVLHTPVKAAPAPAAQADMKKRRKSSGPRP